MRLIQVLLIGARGPAALRVPVYASVLLPPSRRLTIQLGSTLLYAMEWFLPPEIHRRLMWTSALMGMFDVVLDKAAFSGMEAALRVASLIERPAPEYLSPEE